MTKRTMKAGWLVMAAARKAVGGAMMAAALMIGMTACSTDDNMTEEPTVPTTTATQGVQVTVGAGMDNGATTRADVTEAVVEGKTQRTLKFTTGDRLYIWRYINDNNINLTGILTMDSEPTADGLGATFSGTLKAYDIKGNEITDYDYTSLGSDPLTVSKATLIPSGAAAGCFDEANHLGGPFVEQYSRAANVNTLMTTALYVAGDYNGSGYTLTNQMPILNCNLSGLTAGTTYSITLRYAENQAYYESNQDIIDLIAYTPTVTADAYGNVSFAISGQNFVLRNDRYWSLRLEGGGWAKDYIIGQKQFEAKVYNVTRATPDATGVGSAVTTASFGLYFSAFAEGIGGADEVKNVQAPSVTISGSQGSWTVTPTGLATYFRQNVSGLTKEITVVPDETLTFTATGVSYNLNYAPRTNGTFIGTVTVPSGEIGSTLDLGTVWMTRQNN